MWTRTLDIRIILIICTFSVWNWQLNQLSNFGFAFVLPSFAVVVPTMLILIPFMDVCAIILSF